MKCYALLAASLALAAAGPTGVKLVDDDGNFETITFVNGVLSVPQHCRADTCNTLTAFAQAQASENAALRDLITSLRTDLTALSKKHGDDLAASTSADLAFATADTALNQAVAAVTKMHGPKGDTGANGAPGAPGADGKDGKDGTAAAAVVAAADATGPDCQQWKLIHSGHGLQGITGRSPVNMYKAESKDKSVALYVKDTDPIFNSHVWKSNSPKGTVECATSLDPAWKKTVNECTNCEGTEIGKHTSGNGSNGWLLLHHMATAGYDAESPCIIPNGGSLVNPGGYRYAEGKLTEIFACERLPAATPPTPAAKYRGAIIPTSSTQCPSNNQPAPATSCFSQAPICPGGNPYTRYLPGSTKCGACCHQTGYSNATPDPAKATVTYKYASPVTVQQVQMHQHINGVRCIRVRLDGVDAGNSCVSAPGAGFSEGDSETFEGFNNAAGTTMTITIEQTTGNGFAIYNFNPIVTEA
jgi:uncharacterized protein (DUF983 family)